ncbi:phosphopantothenate--cysteine ligase-like isoform X1 [Haliotis rufescens]|uniref:phosphopantothenate--cysteine ligase-like isoform X1 n=2 Tax=Haliotis rufescens TaxID=6454 RepID=UPI00201E9192|nr:phosphopantothenate--cysteine ligase-like isoform X1 [Haliotis rufescens]
MSAASTNQDDFFAQTAVPERFNDKYEHMREFVSKHSAIGNRVVLVSSGGTTVPLESRTVRFIDNFSIGTRGSASAEYFLQQGYAVIFLHRLRSLEPYSRHVQRHMMDMLEAKGDSVTVKREHTSSLKSVLQEYESVKEKDLLLSIDFTSLAEYLHLLRASAQILNTINKKALLYLAAAVSDFYIPKHEMPEHKIQSSTDKPLQLSLQLVPKMLKPLVHEWAPNAFVVSFKLETDRNLLSKKAYAALEKYQHQVVIANLLDTRKYEVVLVTKQTEKPILLSKEDSDKGLEIEEEIVKQLIVRHKHFIES